MGFSSILKKAAKVTIGGIIGSSLSRDSIKPDGTPDTPEEITTANLFASLTPAEKKDLLLNNPNIVTPQGKQYYDPLTNTISLQESDFTKEQRLRQEALAKSLSTQLQGVELPSTDPTARFEEGRKLLDPYFKQQSQQLEQSLADRGIQIGSEAYARALNQLQQSQGEQLQNLAFNSVQTVEAQRQARFNELASLLGQAQVGGVGFSQFSPQFSGLDLFGAQQAQYNRDFQNMISQREQATARRNALIGALGNAGSAAITAAFSDFNLKENITFVNYSNEGVPIYTFEYKDKSLGDGLYQGVMAQDLLDINPSAVIQGDNYLMVDYDKIDVKFKKIN